MSRESAFVDHTTNCIDANILGSANIIPTTSLCIENGKSVWVLYVDATCINYDGNVFDAVLLAMVAALRNSKRHSIIGYPGTHLVSNYRCEFIARLPKAVFNEETGQTICTRKSMLPLDVTKIPISASFGIFDSYVIFSVRRSCSGVDHLL